MPKGVVRSCSLLPHIRCCWLTQARVALSNTSVEYLRIAGIGGARALAPEAVPYVLHELYGGRSSVTARQAADGTDGGSLTRPTKKQKRAMKVSDTTPRPRNLGDS